MLQRLLNLSLVIKLRINDLLNELNSKLKSAKKQSLGKGFTIGNRDELIALVESVRSLLPNVVSDAQEVLNRREAIIQEAKLQAEEVLAQAQIQRDKLASNHEVLLTAAAEAKLLREEVAAEVAKLRNETDEYIDKQLARFEVALTNVLVSVRKGRERLGGELGTEDLSSPN